jgi:hypothetical protein
VIDRDQIAEMAKRPKMIHLRDREHRFEPDPVGPYCSYQNCWRRKHNPLHRVA